MKSQNGIALFCYGSNHIDQIKARVNNHHIVSRKCELPFYKRIFAGKSNGWQNGGVASLIKTDSPYISCRGTYVMLTDDELLKMDKFEGIYSNNPYDKNHHNAYYREHVKTKTENNELINAIAYIKTDNNWINFPSNEYLQACYKNIKPFCNDLDGNNSIMVYDNNDNFRGHYT